MSWTHRKLHDGRMLSIPSDGHKEMLRSLLRDLLRYLPIHPSARAYTQGHSVETSLLPHVGCRYLAHLDIVQFFRSTCWWDVRDGLIEAGVSNVTLDIVESLCFEDDYLPVGSPTSPVLSNIACVRMDNALSAFGTYTRYSDQLIFSSAYPLDERTIRNTVRAHGYRINERKSWLRVRGRQQLVIMGWQIGENCLLRPRLVRRQQRAERHSRRKLLYVDNPIPR